MFEYMTFQRTSVIAFSSPEFPIGGPDLAGPLSRFSAVYYGICTSIETIPVAAPEMSAPDTNQLTVSPPEVVTS